MRPRQRDMSGMNDGLDRPRPVDDDEPARRLRDVLHLRGGRERAPLPVAERALHPGERLVRRHVADHRHHRIVRQIVGAVERHQVIARDGPDRGRRSALRHAVRVEPVDQPVEDDAGDVGWIVVADLKSRQNQVALPLDLGGREGRPARHVGEQVECEVEAVLHHDGVDEPEVACGSHGQRAADVVDGAGDLLGGARDGSLVEELPDERGDPRLAGRVGHRPGAQDHPHVDRRLLVMAHVDHLEAVVERPDLVVRKDDVARQERRRRILARPVHLLRVRLRRDREDEADRRQRRQRRRRAAPGSPPRARRAPRSPRGHCSPRRAPRGRMVSTSRLLSRR